MLKLAIAIMSAISILFTSHAQAGCRPCGLSKFCCTEEACQICDSELDISTLARPCPMDSCNPFNGCTEGCTSEQMTCAETSDIQCVEKTWGYPCRTDHGFSGACVAERLSPNSVPCRCR